VLRVFTDANILYSRTLRNWVFMLRLNSGNGMFQLHCTRDVITETMYSLRRKNPMFKGRQTGEVQKRIENSLDEIVPDFDPSIPFAGLDENDRHVHAAAIAGGTDILLTLDKGFLNLEDQDSLPYEIFHPDDFLILVDDSSPALVGKVTELQRRYWADKKHHGGLEAALVKAACPQFADRVKGHLRVQSGEKS